MSDKFNSYIASIEENNCDRPSLDCNFRYDRYDIANAVEWARKNIITRIELEISYMKDHNSPPEPHDYEEIESQIEALKYMLKTLEEQNKKDSYVHKDLFSMNLQELDDSYARANKD